MNTRTSALYNVSIISSECYELIIAASGRVRTAHSLGLLLALISYTTRTECKFCYAIMQECMGVEIPIYPHESLTYGLLMRSAKQPGFSRVSVSPLIVQSILENVRRVCIV